MSSKMVFVVNGRRPLVVGQCRPPAAVCLSSVRSSSVDFTARCLPVRLSVNVVVRLSSVHRRPSPERENIIYLYYRLTMFEPFLSILFHPISPIIVTDQLLQSVLCIGKYGSNKQISKLIELLSFNLFIKLC